LINGLDDIGLTMQRETKISDFEGQLAAEKPWA
jgi:3-isopropylmalate dehydratase small subunit